MQDCKPALVLIPFFQFHLSLKIFDKLLAGQLRSHTLLDFLFSILRKEW